MRVAFCAISAAVLLAAGQASAAVQLDQSDIPATGVVPAAPDAGSTIISPFVDAQSFTVGKAGTLAHIDLALFEFGTDALGVTVDLLDDGGASVFSQHVASSTMPNILAGSDWSTIPSLDLLSAHIGVSVGDEFTIVVTPDAGTQSGTAWLYFVAGAPLSYSGGHSSVSVNGGPFLPTSAEYGFRTYVASAPEPAAWALMVLGLGATGAALRGGRRRQAA